MFDARLNEIPTFLDVVEAGSFAAAAVRRNVTRSAIAKSIARTETRLGVRLFHRTTRQLTLTDEGGRYYEHCRRLVAELLDMEAAISDERHSAVGCVRISAPVLVGRHCVAPVLRRLLRTHPQLEVQMSLTDRIVDVAAEGFDLAIRVGKIEDSTTLVARKIASQHMAIFASPAYLAKHGRPITMEQLLEHSGVLYGTSTQTPSWHVRDLKGRSHEVHMVGRERYDDLQTVADAAIEDGGLAWLPRWLGAPHVAAGQLEMVMDSDRVVPVAVHAVWPQTRYLPQRIRLTIDALAAQAPAFLD